MKLKFFIKESRARARKRIRNQIRQDNERRMIEGILSQGANGYKRDITVYLP